MIDHIGLAVRDLAASRAFYAAAVAPLGLAIVEEVATAAGHRAVLFGAVDAPPEFVIADGEVPGEGNHIAFRAGSRAAVDAFHAAALAAGGRDNGAPGLRPRYHADYYAAFVLDPAGSNVEAVCHGGTG